MPPSSAIPDFYYFWFAAYEPFLTMLGFIGTCVHVSIYFTYTHSLLTPVKFSSDPITVTTHSSIRYPYIR